MARATSGGPTQIGHVRNAAAPASAKSASSRDDGCSSHATSAHHIATANISETTWAMYEKRANEPTKNARGRKRRATARIPNAIVFFTSNFLLLTSGCGVFPQPVGRTVLLAIKETNPALIATESTITG